MTHNDLTIVWFRQDLRLADNPALCAAAARGAVLPLFISAPQDHGDWAPGAVSRAWLAASLASLGGALRKRGSVLHVVDMHGAPNGSFAALRRIIAATGASAVYWNRLHEPDLAARDREVERALTEKAIGGRSVEVRSFEASLLADPDTFANGQGEAYKVFTPFWRQLQRTLENRGVQTLGVPANLKLQWPENLVLNYALPEGPISSRFHLNHLLKVDDWAAGIIDDHWQPGEAGAAKIGGTFTYEHLGAYPKARDLIAQNGTSRLSPHLHWGELSPRQAWNAAAEAAEFSHGNGKSNGHLHISHAQLHKQITSPDQGSESWQRQLAWREFAYHLLHHFPQTPITPLRPEFKKFPWRTGADAQRDLAAWKRGETGYPLVDAGMRELLATGTMHNRVRMVVASFLIKHLLIDWQEGARWFWERLADADLANNTLGWQWVAGCGADAAPFFRIFNPMIQTKKFDAGGEYIRRHVPELALVSSAALSEAGADGVNPAYPNAIIEHRFARERALDALAELTQIPKI